MELGEIKILLENVGNKYKVSNRKQGNITSQQNVQNIQRNEL